MLGLTANLASKDRSCIERNFVCRAIFLLILEPRALQCPLNTALCASQRMPCELRPPLFKGNNDIKSSHLSYPEPQEPAAFRRVLSKCLLLVMSSPCLQMALHAVTTIVLQTLHTYPLVLPFDRSRSLGTGLISWVASQTTY